MVAEYHICVITDSSAANGWHLFFFNHTATTEIYTLSLHDALPISGQHQSEAAADGKQRRDRSDRAGDLLPRELVADDAETDRKSTRLNSSHANISYAVFCLKKKNSRTRVLCATALTAVLPYCLRGQ